MIKRTLDILVAAVALVLLSPLLLLTGLLIRLESGGPVLFRQERIGRKFRPFKMLKFRTMVADASSRGPLLTVANDPRITRIGRVLRGTKLDELPQLVNVLMGDMSLVGPRPEVRKYVEQFQVDYEKILEMRPGITDLASIRFRHEAAILGQALDPEVEYVRSILPEKIRLAKEYLQRSSLLFDLRVILSTAIAILRRAP